MTRVAVIGPGRVGTLLTVALARAGYRVVAIAGGKPDARAHIQSLVAGVRTHDEVTAATPDADLVVLATPDDAIADVVTTLAVAGAVGDGQRMVHVAGSRGLAPLERAALAGVRVAACHPAMTVPAGARDPEFLFGVRWAVTAAAGDQPWANELVTDLGGDPITIPDDRRGLYHAALTIGSNAVGAAVVVARQLLLAARAADPAGLLAPLVERSVANALDAGAAALTGPVVRGDLGTIERHLEVVDADVPELAAAYRQLSQVVLDRVRMQLAPDLADDLAAMLSKNAENEPPRGPRSDP